MFATRFTAVDVYFIFGVPLLTLLNTKENICWDVILRDLNVNFFSTIDMQPLTDLMESFNYVQIVDKPTFISGSLLDHVYVRQAINANIHTSVISVYYSDHDAVRITLLN